MNKPSIRYLLLRGLLNFIISIITNIKVTGYENFDHNTQYVIVGNHTGFLDPMMVIAKLPRKYQVILIAEEGGAVQANWVQNLIKWGDLPFVGVDRADQKSRMIGLRQVNNLVKQGNSLLIFPEGRINLDDERLYPFYTGSFFVSANNQLPILPVYIRGGSSIYLRRRIHINFGEPIQVTKGDKIEDIAKRTYIAMLEKVKPTAPKNEHKWRPLNLTNAFLGEMDPAPPNLGDMIADGRKANDVFGKSNEHTNDKFNTDE